MSCLDSVALAAWVEGTLGDAERARALTHIADCAVCREVLSALMLAAHDTPEAARRARPDAPAAMPTPGATLGRYQVEGVIASGGMGVVLTAIDPTLQRKVAIKIRRPVGVAQAPQLEARLIQEARALAQLRHPNVVAVYDAGRDGDHLFVVMELVEGESLRAWLARRHPWQDGLGIAIAAGRGLEALHGAGLAHRDVKPDNILLAGEGRVLLADLGLAVQTAASDGPPLTADGAVVGTPRYLAPEQLAGNRGDPRSDQFSFAVVLREALAASDEPPPAWLRAAIQRAMDPDPIHRFASMTELLAALSRPPRRRRAALGVAALATGAAALAWSAWPTRTHEPPAPIASAPLAVAVDAAASIAAPPDALAPDAAAAVAAASPALAPDAAGPADDARVAAAPRKPQRIAPAPASASPARSLSRGEEKLYDEQRRMGITRHPADYDARHFQPSAYFAKARALAREAESDAELIGAVFMPVSRDGSVDLQLADKLNSLACRIALTCGVNLYAFRSPSRSKLPADVPSNARIPRDCMILVIILSEAVAVKTLNTRECQDDIVPPPRCTFAQVWAAAAAHGAPTDLATMISWDTDSRWRFSTALGAAGSDDAFEWTMPDNC